MQTLNDKTLSTKVVAILMLIILATILVTSMLVMAQTAFAAGDVVGDVGDKVARGIGSVTETIKKIVNPLAITAAVICGIFLIVGSDPTSLRRVKSWLIAIIGGLLLVNLADPLVKWANNLAVG